jgi:hypothetical protein
MRALSKITLTFALTIFTALGSPGADGSFGSGNMNFAEKAQKKTSSRWTLQEWLEQKERNRLMDLWLAMYAPSPYEFFFGASYINYTRKYEPATVQTADDRSYSGRIGAYATLIGVEAHYENNSPEEFNDLSGSLNLRILGNAYQGTHLILRYGLRTRDGQWQGNRFRIGNQFVGADLNLYLTKFFGIQGAYHNYIPVDEANLGSVGGSRAEGGAFLDFAAVRIFGNWFQDVQKNERPGSTTSVDRTGVQTGLLFFF